MFQRTAHEKFAELHDMFDNSKRVNLVVVIVASVSHNPVNSTGAVLRKVPTPLHLRPHSITIFSLFLVVAIYLCHHILNGPREGVAAVNWASLHADLRDYKMQH